MIPDSNLIRPFTILRAGDELAGLVGGLEDACGEGWPNSLICVNCPFNCIVEGIKHESKN